MRLLDLREYGTGVHKVPVLLHIKQLIAELALTEDRPASGAVKCQNINIILPALDRIVAPPFAHLEGDKGKPSCFGHANHVLLTDSLKHSTHQIGQIGCDLLGRVLLAKQLVIAAVCKDIAIPEGVEVIRDLVNGSLGGLVLAAGGNPVEQTNLLQRGNISGTLAAVLFDLLSDVVHAACTACNRLKDAIVNGRLAQFHLQQQLRLILQEGTRAKDFLLYVFGNCPLIAEPLKIAGDTAQNTIGKQLIDMTVARKERGTVQIIKRFDFHLCG